MSHYGYSKQFNIPFEEAVEKTIEALKKEGFGVLTDIDVKKTLKEKINVDFKQYRILGACNPKLAHKALQGEEEIGLLLPCNVIVYKKDEGVVVSALRPTALFALVDNPDVESLAEEVEVIMRHVIDSL
jgi:uncharacterized protein (DUF302 family)